MKITFRDITQDNFYECMRLSVRQDQPFVAPNTFSVAESKIFPFWITKAIFADEQMVGFVMYTCDYEAKELYLCRFMIDARYQGKGYGKGALDLLKEIAMGDPGIEKMKLSTSKNNANGIRIYEKFGFKDTNQMEDNEEVFVMDLGKVK
jgi:diamine N-acetyltransferase